MSPSTNAKGLFLKIIYMPVAIYPFWRLSVGVLLQVIIDKLDPVEKVMLWIKIFYIWSNYCCELAS